MTDDPCPTCGCPFPETNHEALGDNIAAIVRQRDVARAGEDSLLGRLQNAYLAMGEVYKIAVGNQRSDIEEICDRHGIHSPTGDLADLGQ